MLKWLVGEEGAIWPDLKTGRMGWLPRVGMSFAAMAFLGGILMAVLGVFEWTVGRVNDHHIAMGIGTGGAIWCGVLTFLWWTHPRGQVYFKTAFGLVAIWMITIPTGVLVDEVFRGAGDYLIPAVILSGLSASLVLLTVIPYRHARRTRPVIDPQKVHCPSCGYSMVGLSDCRCPECGTGFTIDELLRGQSRLPKRGPGRRGVESQAVEAADPETVGGSLAIDT